MSTARTRAPARSRVGRSISAADLKLLFIVLFCLSGASALIYEVAWVRLLSLAFGVSVYAVSIVVSTFMGGLALGSWLFGRLVVTEPRTENRGTTELQNSELRTESSELRATSHQELSDDPALSSTEPPATS